MNSNFSNGPIERYNDQIESLCAAKNVRYLYIYSRFKSSSTIITPTLYVADGIRLNEAGYRVWADAIRGEVIS